MANLLDLPPEILSDILHLFVCSVGLPKSVRARYTCSMCILSLRCGPDSTNMPGTFARAIHNDICSRQPIEAFNDLHFRFFRPRFQRRLLSALLPTILYKMSLKKCRSDYLLRHMNATIAYLQSFTGDDSKSTADIYKWQLCTAIAASLPSQRVIDYLLEGPHSDSTKVRKNMGRADTIGMLAAAAAVGNEPALRFFINKVRSESAVSELYGTPLLAAAVSGQVWATAFILERMRDETLELQLWTTIKTCMETHHVAMLPTLLTWYYSRHSTKNLRSTKAQVALWALKTGNLEVLRLSFSVIKRYQRRHRFWMCDPGHGLFRMACSYGQQHIIHYFLNDGAPPPCKHKHWPASRHLTLGLQLAATNGWLVAAKLLLDSGAMVNDTVTEESDTAIACAVGGGHVDMVVLLLAYGAYVPLNDGIWSGRGGWQKRSIVYVAREQGSSMNRVIEQAVEQQRRRDRIGRGEYCGYVRLDMES
jgi:hypothetical protein